MNCVDCTNPSVANGQRCAECIEEVQETPGWRGPRRGNYRVTPAPEGKSCPACLRPQSSHGRRGKWCSESCRSWARFHPGELRVVDRPCARCGVLISVNRRAFCSDLCREIASGVRRDPAIPPSPPRPPKICADPECGRPARARGLCSTHYNKATGHYIGSWQKDPELERARQRLKTHRRKDWSRHTDITPEYELGLRVKAKRCPLCSVALTDEPYLPHSKELDHIIPRNVGGTHTIGNVRITCRACNLRRPKDGSDYFGPVTLWAQAG